MYFFTNYIFLSIFIYGTVKKEIKLFILKFPTSFEREPVFHFFLFIFINMKRKIHLFMYFVFEN